MLVRAILGTTYAGIPEATVYFDVENQAEFDSDEFSTDILNAIFNGEFDHMFMDVDTVEKEDLDEDELEDVIDCIGYDPFEEDEEGIERETKITH